jgi:hypothetical protein
LIDTPLIDRDKRSKLPQFFLQFFWSRLIYWRGLRTGTYFWSRLIYFRPIFGVKIGVASWVRRGRRPCPAAGRPNPIWQPQF